MSKKIIELNGVKYKLTPIKEDTKITYAVFSLEMPGCGSWNGKWTGHGKKYSISKRIINRRKSIYPLLKEASYLYDFKDGWVARVNVVFTTKTLAVQAEKESDGFCGYEWMVNSLLKKGKIEIS